MSEIPDQFKTQPFPAETVYEFRISGRLGHSSQAWFTDMDIIVDESSSLVQTIIRGPMRDQSALYGLISRIRDLGLTLISVNRVERKEGEMAK